MQRGIFWILLLFSSSLWAMPAKIILIRHADKLEQMNTGPALSPEGIQRANHFAQYYLTKFEKIPDYIIATNPNNPNCTKPICAVGTIRPLQTVAPLITEIYRRDPQTKKDLLLAPYPNKQFPALIHLLNANYLNNTFLLICLGHKHIPEFLQTLTREYQSNLTLPNKWKGDDFNTVYVLTFANAKKQVNIEILRDQY